VVTILALRHDGLWFDLGPGARRIGDESTIGFAALRGHDLVALLAKRRGLYSLELASLRNGDIRVIYQTDRCLLSPRWHPSGSELVMVEQDLNGRGRLLSVNAGSGAVHARELFAAAHSLAEPDWSADGRWLAIEAQPIDTLRGMTVYVYQPEAGSMDLVDPADSPEPKAACPRFSPTGETLAYAYTGAGVLDSEIRLYDPVRQRGRMVGVVGMDDPRWADDGSMLLVARHTHVCVSDLWVLELGAGKPRPRQLTTSQAEGVFPVHLDNGRALYLARACPTDDEAATAPGELWIVELTSRKRERLAIGVMQAAVV